MSEISTYQALFRQMWEEDRAREEEQRLQEEERRNAEEEERRNAEKERRNAEEATRAREEEARDRRLAALLELASARNLQGHREANNNAAGGPAGPGTAADDRRAREAEMDALLNDLELRSQQYAEQGLDPAEGARRLRRGLAEIEENYPDVFHAGDRSDWDISSDEE